MLTRLNQKNKNLTTKGEQKTQKIFQQIFPPNYTTTTYSKAIKHLKSLTLRKIHKLKHY